MPLVRNGSGVVHEVPEGHWALTSGDFTPVQPEPRARPLDPALDEAAAEALETLTVRELRELADERGVTHAGLRKAELVRALS